MNDNKKAGFSTGSNIGSSYEVIFTREVNGVTVIGKKGKRTLKRMTMDEEDEMYTMLKKGVPAIDVASHFMISVKTVYAKSSGWGLR